MAADVLSGVKIIVWAETEAIRSELYATLAIDGWHTELQIAENLEEFKKFTSESKDGALPVIIDSNAEITKQLVDELFQSGFETHQIVLGCPKNSFTHRLLLRNKIDGFFYENEKTALGPKIDITGLVPSLLRAWKTTNSLLLDREVNDAVSSGMLACIKVMAHLPSSAIPKERAHLAYALAEQINNDISFRKRVIRYALYSDLKNVLGKEDIIAERRSLWPIRDLFEESASLRVVSTQWPATLPLECAIVKTVELYLAHKNGGGSVEFMEAELNEAIKNLKLENRTSLKIAFSAVFARKNTNKIFAVG